MLKGVFLSIFRKKELIVVRRIDSLRNPKQFRDGLIELTFFLGALEVDRGVTLDFAVLMDTSENV
jgi:hypothetical protein